MKKVIIFSGILIVIAGILFTVSQFRLRSTQIQQTQNTEQGVGGGSSLGGIIYPSTPLLSPEGQRLQQEIADRIISGNISTETSEYFKDRIVDVYPPDLSISQIPDYETFFNDSTKQLSIQLNLFPLADTRIRAEKYLLEKLGITQEQACLLGVQVFVDPTTSTSLAGQNLGLSFCSGAVDLSAYTENVDGVSYGEQQPTADTSL